MYAFKWGGGDRNGGGEPYAVSPYSCLPFGFSAVRGLSYLVVGTVFGFLLGRYTLLLQLVYRTSVYRNDRKFGRQSRSASLSGSLRSCFLVSCFLVSCFLVSCFLVSCFLRSCSLLVFVFVFVFCRRNGLVTSP